jgi:hypothetical protein
VSLADDLERIAGLAAAHAEPGDAVSGILATEPSPGERVYVCSFDGADGYRSWLAVRDDGSPVARRADLREAVSIAALCEVAAEAAAGGNAAELVARLEEVRQRDAPDGIEAAIAAARTVAEVVGEPPQLATPDRLDAIGTATRELERELDPVARSPFSTAMQAAQGAVAELQREVEAGYRIELV